MLRKIRNILFAVGAIGALSAYVYNTFSKSKSNSSVKSGSSTIAGLTEWNSSLQREIVRSHRDARDVCIAVLSVQGVNKQFDVEMHSEIERKFAAVVRGSDLLAGNDTGEFFLLFPEAGLDEGYEAVERLQETLPPTTSLAAGIAVWDHCETSAELVARAVTSMKGTDKSSRAKINVSETPLRV